MRRSLWTLGLAAALMAMLAPAGWSQNQGTNKDAPKQAGDRAADRDNKSGKADNKNERGNKDDAKAGEALDDAGFVMHASAMDLAEINLGRLAATKATSPEVKQFAQQMVADHTRTSEMMRTLANQKQLKLAREMDAKHRTMSEEMAKMNGADFDRAYIHHMVTDHKKAVDLFQHEAKNGKDADVKALAEKALPVIQQHLKMAQSMDRSGGSGTDKAPDRNKDNPAKDNKDRKDRKDSNPR